jgi:hypothetical protein
MRNKITIILVGVIILLGSVGFYATPYLAYRNMRIAAENKDNETLNSYVDFKSLKESLKANLNDKISREAGSKKDEDAMDKLGAAIVSAFINPMVDAFVTPDGLAMIVRGSIPDRKKTKHPAETKSENGAEKKSSHKDSEIETSMYYENLNNFIVAFKQKSSAEDQVRLVFKRNGIVSWKLCAMDLP